MNVVFIIPTGLGCAIGGHVGDATPAAKMIAQTCDKIILHPNVVNACDINEMPANALYVEGSILDWFLEGKIELQEVHSNRVLVAVNPPIKPETVNAVRAAQATIGMDVEIVELETPLVMKAWIEDDIATGTAEGVEELIQQVTADLPSEWVSQNIITMRGPRYHFDALAIASPIQVPEGVALAYYRDSFKGVNPWGGIEAIVSRRVADAINKPTAHAPIETDDVKGNPELFNILFWEKVNKRKAAEVISSCYIHCILKGLHKAPRIGRGIARSSVACLVTPTGCIGRPHRACLEAGIPVIAVTENTVARKSPKFDDRVIYVKNYLEAAGVISCMKAGVTPSSVRAD